MISQKVKGVVPDNMRDLAVDLGVRQGYPGHTVFEAMAMTNEAQGANVRATSKGGANAQRRAGVKKNEGGRERRNTTRKGQTGRLQMTPRKRAKMVECGLEPDGKMPQLLSGETAEIQHCRLMAEADARKILARAEDGGNITDEDILRVFRHWAFKKNDVRVNVIPRPLPFSL